MFFTKGISSYISSTWSVLAFFISLMIFLRYAFSMEVFHFFAEFFPTIVALMIGLISTYTHSFTKNNYLLFIGVGYFWVGILDLFHSLTFPGINIFEVNYINTTINFWILTRILESTILFSAVFFIKKEIKIFKLLLVYFLISSTIFYISIFSPFTFFIKDVGLTTLKTVLEYFVIFISFVTLIVNKIKIKQFNYIIYKTMFYSILFTIFSEFCLTLYVDYFSLSVLFGHIFKFISFWFIFDTIIKLSITQPIELLANNASSYNAIPLPALVVSKNGQIIQTNIAACTYLDLDSTNIIGKSNHKLFHTTDVSIEDCCICNAINNNEIINQKIVHDTKTQSYKQYSLFPLNVDKKHIGMIQTVQDITQNIVAQEKLVKSEKNFRDLFENAEVSIWNEDFTKIYDIFEDLRSKGITDLKKYLLENQEASLDFATMVQVKDINKATLKMFAAKTKEDFILRIDNTFGKNAIDVFQTKLIAIWNKEKYFREEANFKTLDGKDIYGIISFQIPTTKDEFKSIPVSIIDITQQTKDQKYIKILYQAIEQTPISIVITDTKGNITYVNHSFETTTGYSKKEILGKNTSCLKSGKTDISVYKNLWNTVTNGEIWSGELENKKKNGEIYWESINISPVRDNNKNINYFLAIKKDITEKKLLLTKLEDKEKLILLQSKQAAVGETINMIAHQWRQPLNAITGITNNLILDIKLDEVNKDNFENKLTDLNMQIKYLSNTIDDFRNFLSPNNIKKYADINLSVQKSLDLISKTLQNNNIKVEFTCKQSIKIFILENELIQVLINILNNAKDNFIDKKTENSLIIIDIFEENEYVNISIKDNGGGIDIAIIDKIFDPYFSTKKAQQGTGLGLYMSKKVIEEHLGGKLKAINIENGVEFIITLQKNVDSNE